MNNSDFNFMNKYYKTIASVMVTFALVLSAFAAPLATAVATTQLEAQFDFESEYSFDGTPDYLNDEEESEESDDSSSNDEDSNESEDGGEESEDSEESSSDDEESEGSEDSEEPNDEDSNDPDEYESENSYTECSFDVNREQILVGEGVTLNWETFGFDDIKINGESVSGDSGSKSISNLRENTTFVLEALSDGGSKCKQEVHVTCLPHPTLVRCEDFGYDFQIAKFEWNGHSFEKESLKSGYSVSVSGNAEIANWTAGPEVAGVIAKAATVVEEFDGGTSGAVYKSSIGTGMHDVSNIAFCGNEQSQQCELIVEKSVNKNTALPGELLTYTIDIENVGDANCTGGGVKIYDVVDANLSYESHQLTSNLSAGYGDNPIYTTADRTIRVNGHILEPGETGSITWTGKVNTPAQCGDFEVNNQAKATARELNNFQTWVYSETVSTAIDYNCEVPKTPVCTLEPAEGRTIVTFDGLKLRTDRGVDQAYTATQELAVEAGVYDITLVSWDGYTNRVNTYQPHEQWVLEFMNDGSVVGTSNAISDLEDNVLEAMNQETVNVDYTLATAATGVRAAHPFYPDGVYANSLYPICAAIDAEPVVPAPTCDAFTANPTAIMVGESTTLTWETSNAVEVFLNNAIGAVDPDGSIQVSPLADITYELTVMGTENQMVTCEVPVTVSEDPVPMCELFTATPSSLPVGGGSVTLDWEVLNATDVTIAPIVGTVGLVGSSSVDVTESTTFSLTAIDGNGDQVTCPAPVVVADPEPDPLTCANNVSFSASDTSIRRGNDVTLTWSTTDVDSVLISGVNATALAGSQVVSPADDITYTLTATQGSETVSCPVSIDVSSGGGGGGGSSVRCELEISDNKIKPGEEITLTWDTSLATEVTLTDDRGNEIFSTDDFLASDKDDYFDGSIDLKPTRDTKYTLLAERGSRDEECSVSVDVEDTIVVLQTRDQQPLVAGISLSQVPYTGFEAGPLMTIMFYALLVAWSLYITYLIVIRNRPVTPDSQMPDAFTPSNGGREVMQQAEKVRPDVFVESVTTTPAPSEVAPMNLPTGGVVVGYENQVEEAVNPHQANDAVVTELENRAHTQKALLSSDAVRHFIGTTTGKVERNEALDAVIVEAKKMYPLEDGWIVINESRMQNLCVACKINEAAEKDVTFVPATVPEGSGSLAEAILAGNVVAAYEMIGKRPMFALADAAADLDALYRYRRGGKVEVSDLLISEAKNLSDEKIKSMISALTSALDGTYNDEPSAVKMAIMKAVKEMA